MPQPGVSVPRSKVHRGDRWSDDLELEFPSRRVGRVRSATPRQAAHAYDESSAYNQDLDLDLASWVNGAPARPEPPPATAEPAGRRTVIIQGRPNDGYRPTGDSRRRQPPHYRAGFQPDRVAMWAVFLGLVLLLVAATSSHAAVLSAQSLTSLAVH